jgi:uncharacterized membrane protein YdjX (TVP38/TMEM64 family)
MRRSMKHFKKYFPLLLILALALIAWFSGVSRYFNLESLRAHQQTLEVLVKDHLLISLLTFMGCYIIVVGLSIPAASFMTIAGGILFGQWIGTGMTVIAATLGASVLFASARLASTDLGSRKKGSWVHKMQKGFQENAFSYLLTLRLIPIFPFAAINLAAALLQIPFRTFFFGTLIGIIPGAFVYTSMGVALRTVLQKPNFTANLILDPRILTAFIGLGLLSLLPVVYKWVQHRRSK